MQRARFSACFLSVAAILYEWQIISHTGHLQLLQDVQVPQLRVSITQGRNWAAIADRQLKSIFRPDSLDMSSIQAFADTIDQLEALVPDASQKVSC